jgi:hypothetical protein
MVNNMQMPVDLVNVRKVFSPFHLGLDLGFDRKILGKNQPIRAIYDGVVIYNRYQVTGGYVIHIRHANGYVSEYGHLKKNSQKVKEGMKVKKGQQIALMGNTGLVTGYHLHFGMYKGDKINYSKKSNFVDPTPFLCMYDNQQYRSNSLIKNFAQTKKVTGVPSEPLNVRDSKNKIVDGLYNGNEVEYYGKNGTKAIVDNIKNYTTIDKYLK